VKTCHGCGREVVEIQKMDNHPTIHSGPGGCWGPCEKEKGKEIGMKNFETWMSGVSKPGPVEIPACFLAFACGCERQADDPTHFAVWDEEKKEWRDALCGGPLVVYRKPKPVLSVAATNPRRRERCYLGELRH